MAIVLGLAVGATPGLAGGGKSGAQIKTIALGSALPVPPWPKAAPPMDSALPYMFSRLSTQDRQAFNALVAAYARDLEASDKLQGAFADLLRLVQLAVFGQVVKLTVDPKGYLKVEMSGQGSLGPDSDAAALLRLLATRVNQPLGGGILPGTGAGALRPADMVRVIAHIVAAPESISQGTGTYTCVSAALERVLAQTWPGEYARITAGLVWDGRVALQNGKVVPIAGSAKTGPGGGKRTVCSKAFQESLLGFAQQVPPETCTKELGDYRNARLAKSGGTTDPYGGGRYSSRTAYSGGRYSSAATYGAGRFSSVRVYGAGEMATEPAPTGAGEAAYDGAAAPGGVTIGQARWLYIQVLGDTPQTLVVTDGNRDSVFSRLVYVLGKKNPLPVIAGVKGVDAAGNATHHVVTLISYAQSGSFQLADSGQDGDNNQITVDAAGLRAALELVFDF